MEQQNVQRPRRAAEIHPEEPVGHEMGDPSPAPNSRVAAGPCAAGSGTRDLVVAVMISAFIILFLYQPVRVEGTSMLPMLEDQDRLFINKFAYRFGEIQRGRCGGVSVSGRPHEELHQARDCAARRRSADRPWQVYVNGRR
jgi:hypothetical protein